MRTTIAILLLFQLVSTVHADERSVAREHYIKGNKEFDLGLYEDAIQDLMAAYQAKDDPAFLYNIAQAHRLAGHPNDALRFYRVYLVKVPRAPNRADVEIKIAELEKAVDQQHRTQTQLPPDQALKPSVQPEAAPPPKLEVVEEPKSTVPVIAIAPRDLRPAKHLKTAGVATIGAGAVLAAVGIGMAFVASAQADAISRAPTFSQSQLDAYHSDRAVEGALLGVGSAAIVAGAIVYGVGWHRSHSPRLSLVPTSLPGGAGLNAFGSW